MRQTKLVVLRGPSGAEKSTVAKAVLKDGIHKLALIEQDHYRFVFKPRSPP
jgi:guanylate kinase